MLEGVVAEHGSDAEAHYELGRLQLTANEEEAAWQSFSAAESLGISARTLRLAVERGEIQADHPLNDGPWVFNRRALENEAAVRLVARVRSRRDFPAKPTAGQTSLNFSNT